MKNFEGYLKAYRESEFAKGVNDYRKSDIFSSVKKETIPSALLIGGLFGGACLFAGGVTSLGIAAASMFGVAATTALISFGNLIGTAAEDSLKKAFNVEYVEKKTPLRKFGKATACVSVSTVLALSTVFAGVAIKKMIDVHNKSQVKNELQKTSTVKNSVKQKGMSV